MNDFKRNGWKVVPTSDATIEDTVNSFDARAQDYSRQENEEQQKLGHIRTNTFYNNSIREILTGKDVKLLDIGCALGTQTKDFIDTVSRYANVETTAIDVSPKMIEAAKKVLKNATVVLRDMNYTGFFHNTFDVVRIGHSTIGFSDDNCNAMKHFHDILKHDGVLLIDAIAREKGLVMNAYSDNLENDRAFLHYKTNSGVAVHRIYTKSEIENLAHNTGFNIIAYKEISFNDTKDSMVKHAFVLQN